MVESSPLLCLLHSVYFPSADCCTGHCSRHCRQHETAQQRPCPRAHHLGGGRGLANNKQDEEWEWAGEKLEVRWPRWVNGQWAGSKHTGARALHAGGHQGQGCCPACWGRRPGSSPPTSLWEEARGAKAVPGDYKGSLRREDVSTCDVFSWTNAEEVCSPTQAKEQVAQS